MIGELNGDRTYTVSGLSEETKKQYEIVVGIDFGTTYSGVAYARVGELESGRAVISNIDKWPGITAYSQTPTRSAYLNGKLSKWGAFQIVNKATRIVTLFKLQLDETKIHPYSILPYGLELEQVISDYLRSIYEHMCTVLEGRFRRTLDTSKLRFCLTVPAVWTEKAKNIMRDAVIRAGIISKEDPQDRLLLVGEPEAAALYCETFLNEYNLKPGQNFLICDAGGGTVDLVVYRISVDKNGKNSLMEEVAGDGAICGSTTLDANFRRFVSENMQLFFEDEYPLTDKELDVIVKTFTEKTKSLVRHPSNPDYDEDHFDVALPDRFGEKEYGEEKDKLFVTDSQLYIHPEIMLSEIFDPVIDQVLSLIDTQLERIDRTLDAIFLVGGFGQSTYLLQKIKDEFADDVALICAPARGEMAIVRGAVLMGLDPQFVKQRVVRRTYGYECSLGFDNALDPKRLRTVDQDGEVYCNNRFRSYALKGEVRDVDYYAYTSFKCYYNKNPVLQLYAYDGNPEQLPRYTTDPAVKKVTEFEIILPHLPGKGPSDTVVINVKFYLYQTEIKLECGEFKAVTVMGRNRSINVAGANKLTMAKTNEERKSNDSLKKDENAWFNENCPADSVNLGKAAWTLLHTTAAYYPDRPAPSQMDSMRLFMSSFIDNYPCFKKEFKEYMVEEPVRVGSRKKLSEWLCRQHNKVNERLGKPSFDCKFVLDRWLQGSLKQCDQ